ncbi:sensor histidine kinase [Pseudonocardia humida]|uniref:histidine kinase n=1 Tax=Pseudonocardia humida TaxID=2800819 RepID=A0ABT0ZVW5_9PSEU|nr:histidine kinase [Pseudonocardia humida]MCO1654868.1 histidine kinase [Pseudonocardia humida]
MRAPTRLDAAIAGALGAGGLAELALGALPDSDPLVAAGVIVIAAGALLLRTRVPLVAFGVALLVLAASELPGDGVGLTASMALGLLVALSSVAQRCAPAVGAAAATGTFALFGALSLLGDRPWDVMAMLLGTGSAWGIGRLVRREQERSAELAAVAAQLALEREARADEAVRVERGRIARELHDAVAHIVSVMTLQVGGVRRLLDAGGGHDREAGMLRGVEDLGREAVAELHRVVGVLRALAAEPDGESGLAPPPRLEHVGQLAERIRSAGLPVDLRVEGEPRPLPGGLDLAAYRIVQEGLTNALKHAGPARARVVVRYDPAELTVSVVDDGAGGPGEPAGHGLAGMRERVGMYGGELETGAAPGGGWAVRARLPAPP